MTARPDFAVEGRAWPHREHSRFVEAGGTRFHVQEMGQGHSVLLLHGSGAATHSWRGLMPALARDFHVVAPDLPGHGFSSPLPPRQSGLPAMADAIAGLVRALGLTPRLVVGHSAGAAILTRLCLDRRIEPDAIIGLNPALFPPLGPATDLVALTTRWMGRSPWVARLFAAQARDGLTVQRFLRATGSNLDPDGIKLYETLASHPGHVAGTLAMMAAWSLTHLAQDLPRLRTPCLLLVGAEDRLIPPEAARRAAALTRAIEVEVFPGLGHLAHEEEPMMMVERIKAFHHRARDAACASRA